MGVVSCQLSVVSRAATCCEPSLPVGFVLDFPPARAVAHGATAMSHSTPRRCKMLQLVAGRALFVQIAEKAEKLKKQDHFPGFLSFLRVRGAEKAGRR